MKNRSSCNSYIGGDRTFTKVILSFILLLRGYFPRGGGEITVQASPVHQLIPVDMTNPGTIKRITGRAFVAGVIPFKVTMSFTVI